MFKQPTFETLSFSQMRAAFEMQVDRAWIEGQRAHKARANVATKVKHITGNMDTPVSTQAVMHAVSYRKGKAKKYVLQLVDGFHRMLLWMEKNHCPFEQIILITHHVEAATELEIKLEIDKIQKSLDSKASVKGNADWWAGALYTGGIKQPVSKAYILGTNAGSFFKRSIVMGNPNEVSTPKMAELVAKHLDAHLIMDNLYRRAETVRKGKLYFPPGVALGVFKFLTQAPALGLKFEEAMHTALGQATDQSRTKPASKLAALLIDQARPEFEYEFMLTRGRTSKEAFYTSYAVYFSAEVKAIMRSKSKLKLAA
jgi:hypothetical protein